MNFMKGIGSILGVAVIAMSGISVGTACSLSRANDAENAEREVIKEVETTREGQDDLVPQVRNHSGFTGVDIGGAMTATINVGRDFEVIVETTQELQEKVISKVDDGRLIVKWERNWWKEMRGKYKRKNVRLTISLPTLDDLDISGATKASVTGVNSEKLDIDISGASNVSIEGNARNINVDLSGASNLKAGKLVSETATMDLSGASYARVSVSTELDVDASGASSVRYDGEPRVTKDTSGASSVRKN